MIAGDLGANGFDQQYSYNIRLIVTDEITSITYDGIILGTGKPNLAIHRDGVAINQPYDENLGGSLQVNGGKVLNILEVYPIGSIHMSVNSTNPSSLFGGTWEEFAKGRTLVGVDTSQTEFNSVEKIGGAKTHTLTIGEMPSHRHNIQYPLLNTGAGVNSIYGMGFNASANGGVYTSNGPQTSGETRIGIYDTGGNQPHNNLQPYITVYMWKRVA